MEDQKIGLTIFLLRPDQVAAFEKELLGAGQGVLPLAEPLDGVFLPLPSGSGEPRWVSVIRSALQVSTALTLNAQFPSGLLVVRRAGKSFVLSFGHAWQKLKDQWLERDFGRRVALNSIARNKLVEIRVEQVFAKWHLASERAPRASSVDEFSVEFDRDLVAAVEGIPSDSLLGKKIRGGTSLRVNLPFGKLGAVLDKATRLFESNAYKKTWPDVDNVSPVIDHSVISRLEAQLDTELMSGQAQKKIVMFTPAHRRDESLSADSYVFGRLSKTPVMTPYLTVDGWIAFLKRKKLTPCVAEAKNTPIHLLDEDKEEIKDCTAFDCFGYELALDGQQYVLWSSIWYEVVSEFVARINRTADKIPAPSVNLPTWNQVESEREYNLRCANKAAFLHFDARNVLFGGGQSRFEFCDLLHLKTKTLLFAKIASKSSGMSHLVEQVRRTAELLFSTDAGYRQELVGVFARYHPKVDVEWLRSRPRNGDWHLCMVSLGRSARQLPFFAKCALVKVYKDLSERGHEVSFVAV